MERAIFVTVAAGLVALGGLLFAAGAEGTAGQLLGFGIVVLAWAVAVGYHGRRSERTVRGSRESSRPAEPVPSTPVPGDVSMIQSLVVSIVFAVLGLVGLLMAAGAHDGVTQVMGFGILVLSWFLMVGYHARRAETSERARLGTAH